MKPNQFFYTRKEEVPTVTVEGQEPEKKFVDRIDSFNADFVIRSIQSGENTLMILLNDFHEETQRVPIMNKQNKFSGSFKNEKAVVCSQIYLEGDDVKRFREFMGYIV